MSQENVETVRRLLWAFENDADAFESMLSSELVWFPFEDNHTPGVRHRGREADQGVNGWMPGTRFIPSWKTWLIRAKTLSPRSM